VDPVVYASSESPEGPLSREQLASYARDGFLFLPETFTLEEVAALRNEMDNLRNDSEVAAREATITEPGSRDIRTVFEIHKVSRCFDSLSRDRRLAGVAKHILDDEIYISQSRLNYKPGFRGKEFYWHSDFETWHTEDGMPRMRALSISVSLTDTHSVNGPLMVIPGSHRYYLSCVGETPEEHYKTSLKKQDYGVPDDDSLSQLVRERGIAAPAGPAGSVLIFDCNLMHGSNSNITPYPRSNAFFAYNAMSNRLGRPFGGMDPRPDFLAERRPVPLEESSLAA
jgi:ectoine hydroxylase